MRIPALITLTGLPAKAEGVDCSLAVRADLVAVVQRGEAALEKAPVAGASGPGKPKPVSVECTIVSLTIGGQLLVRESVAEVTALVKKNDGRGLFK